MTQVRVIDDRLAVHSGTDVSSPIVAELRAGDEFTLGEVVEVSGVKWATATLLNGKGGYVPGNAKISRIRLVKLGQQSVDVYMSPTRSSAWKAAFKSGDKFTVEGMAQEGEKQWVEVRTLSGDRGFIPSGTRIVELADSPATRPKTLACPKCSKAPIHRPFGWKEFQASVLVYVMCLFTTNKAIEVTRPQPHLSPGDLVNNPFVQRAAPIAPPASPDYSIFYVVAVLGFFVVGFMLYSALYGKNTCESCGYRWRGGAKAGN